jgi:hypothetical protein
MPDQPQPAQPEAHDSLAYYVVGGLATYFPARIDKETDTTITVTLLQSSRKMVFMKNTMKERGGANRIGPLKLTLDVEAARKDIEKQEKAQSISKRVQKSLSDLTEELGDIQYRGYNSAHLTEDDAKMAAEILTAVKSIINKY